MLLLLDEDNIVLSLSKNDLKKFKKDLKGSKENSHKLKDSKDYDKFIDPHKGKYKKVQMQLLAILATKIMRLNIY